MKKDTNGYIRIKNSNWVEGAEVLAPFAVNVTTKKLKLTLDKSSIFMNNTSTTEKDTVQVSFNESVLPDMSNVTLDTSKVSKKLNVSLNKTTGVITITGAKGVAVKTYDLNVIYNDDSISQTATLKIYVKKTKATEALSFERSGGVIDPLFDSRIYLKPTVKDYAGYIKSAEIKLNTKCKKNSIRLYKVKWDGTYIVVSHGKDWVYQEGGFKETIRLEMSTGTYVYGTIKIESIAGALDFYASGMNVSVRKDYSATAGAYCNYTYNYYTGPKTYERRLHVMDFDHPDLIKVQKDDDFPEERELFTVSDKVREGQRLMGTEMDMEYKSGLITATVKTPGEYLYYSDIQYNIQGYFGLSDKYISTPITINFVGP